MTENENHPQGNITLRANYWLGLPALSPKEILISWIRLQINLIFIYSTKRKISHYWKYLKSRELDFLLAQVTHLCIRGKWLNFHHTIESQMRAIH
jgi:hypothetical protein